MRAVLLGFVFFTWGCSAADEAVPVDPAVVTSVDQPTLERLHDLAEDSEFIGSVRVDGVNTRWHQFAEMRAIVTEYDLRVMRTLKGVSTEGEKLVVISVGGTLDGITHQSSAEPVLTLDEEAVVFVAKVGVHNRFVGGALAAMNVDDDAVAINESQIEVGQLSQLMGLQ